MNSDLQTSQADLVKPEYVKPFTRVAVDTGLLYSLTYGYICR